MSAPRSFATNLPPRAAALAAVQAMRDIDVLVVSASLGYGELFGALETATTTLGRTVNPTLYTPDDFAQRRAEGNAFATRLLDQPKLWLIGSDEVLDG